MSWLTNFKGLCVVFFFFLIFNYVQLANLFVLSFKYDVCQIKREQERKQVIGSEELFETCGFCLGKKMKG